MRVVPHVYACIITLYRGYCVQYSRYAGTPVFTAVFLLSIIKYYYYYHDVDYYVVDARP